MLQVLLDLKWQCICAKQVTKHDDDKGWGTKLFLEIGAGGVECKENWAQGECSSSKEAGDWGWENGNRAGEQPCTSWQLRAK